MREGLLCKAYRASVCIAIAATGHGAVEREFVLSTNGGAEVGGIGVGGLLVIIGIVLAIFWSLWIGLIIALVGLIAFGGFARGRWY